LIKFQRDWLIERRNLRKYGVIEREKSIKNLRYLNEWNQEKE
jgi:hypothetical protein